MNLELAQLVAMETLKACRNEGYQVSVAVVDRSGGIQTLVRDRLAGIFTTDIAVRKARTALSFHTDTINLVEPTKSGTVASGIRDFPDAMIVAEGVEMEEEMVALIACGAHLLQGYFFAKPQTDFEYIKNIYQKNWNVSRG